MLGNVRHRLSFAILYLFVAVAPGGGVSAATAAPLTPWFHIHVHRAVCLRYDTIPFFGQLCVDSRYLERDAFLFREGVGVDVSSSRRFSRDPATVEPLRTILRSGSIPAARLEELRQAVGAALFPARRGDCDPTPGAANVVEHDEVVWYAPSTAEKILDLSSEFERPCSAELLEVVDRVLELTVGLPAR